VQLLNQPFPQEWRDVLWRRVPLYSLINPDEQVQFEREIQLFLGEQRIYIDHTAFASYQNFSDESFGLE
jgi:Mlc titration factor MtfA (ptsG expression regulator)